MSRYTHWAKATPLLQTVTLLLACVTLVVTSMLAVSQWRSARAFETAPACAHTNRTACVVYEPVTVTATRFTDDGMGGVECAMTLMRSDGMRYKGSIASRACDAYRGTTLTMLSMRGDKQPRAIVADGWRYDLNNPSGWLGAFAVTAWEAWMYMLIMTGWFVRRCYDARAAYVGLGTLGFMIGGMFAVVILIAFSPKQPTVLWAIAGLASLALLWEIGIRTYSAAVRSPRT